LATIKTDVLLPLNLKQLKHRTPDDNALLELFVEQEFKAWTAELTNRSEEAPQPVSATAEETEASTISPQTKHYETVLTEHQLQKWIEKIVQKKQVAVDTETTSLDYMAAKMVGISLAVEPGEAAYIPFGHDYLGAPIQLPEGHVIELLKPLLEDPNIEKIGQNLKYDMSIFAQHGINLQGISFDTMLESYVIDSVATRHDMDSLAETYLAEKTIKFTDVAGKGSNQLSFNQIALEQAAPYAAEDADITLRLHQTLWPKVQAESSLLRVFSDIELPLVPVL
jgi:DNA polymerase-1